jgi:cold shock CspA family protein
MGRSQETFSKKEKEKKRKKKKEEKMRKREERKENSTKGTLENMMAYVDEFGNITDTPPDPERKKEEVKAENIVVGVPKKEDNPEDAIREGVVTFFNHDKGYGFIRDSRTQESFFVHVNDLKEEIKENDRVTFELQRGHKGMQAAKVKKK